MAFRIIVADVAQCYQALGLLHGRYQVLPERFKDIPAPKPNGYRSLHTGVIGPNGQQPSRSRSAPRRCTSTPSSASPRTGSTRRADRTDGPQYGWLRELLDILDTPNARGVSRAHQARDVPGSGLLLHAQGRAYRPAARRDAGRFRLCRPFAGRRYLRRRQDQRHAWCRCARSLLNGDQVEIVTSKAQTPSPTWERFVVTGKAARVSAATSARSSARSISISARRSCKRRSSGGPGIHRKAVCRPYSSNSPAPPPRTSTSRWVRGTDGPRGGPGRVSAAARCRAKSKVGAACRRGRRKGNAERQGSLRCRSAVSSQAWRCISRGCCHPLPGDRIVGIVTTGKGVTIHTIDCDTLETYSDTPERWIDVAGTWSSEGAAAIMSAGSTSRSPTSPATSAA